ncbi:hypothetical protein B0H13DRAFT_2532210 [Mycena leptocephala]|nr:hypothetical protein B0H13DRAFT_2532210 [Mycena leptocephala]
MSGTFPSDRKNLYKKDDGWLSSLLDTIMTDDAGGRKREEVIRASKYAQAQYETAKAAGKLTDQALKDAQAKLSEAKGTTRQKRRTGSAVVVTEPSFLQASSSGRMISPRRVQARAASISVSVAASPLILGVPDPASSGVVRNVPLPQPLFPLVSDALFPAIGQAEEPLVAHSPPFFDGDLSAIGDSSWFDNFQFMAEPQPPTPAIPNYSPPYLAFDPAGLFSMGMSDAGDSAIFSTSASSDSDAWSLHGRN